MTPAERRTVLALVEQLATLSPAARRRAVERLLDAMEPQASTSERRRRPSRCGPTDTSTTNATLQPSDLDVQLALRAIARHGGRAA